MPPRLRKIASNWLLKLITNAKNAFSTIRGYEEACWDRIADLEELWTTRNTHTHWLTGVEDFGDHQPRNRRGRNQRRGPRDEPGEWQVNNDLGRKGKEEEVGEGEEEGDDNDSDEEDVYVSAEEDLYEDAEEEMKEEVSEDEEDMEVQPRAAKKEDLAK